MSLAEAEAIITMFNCMIKEQVPTNDVRQFTVKQAAQCRIYKQTNRRLEKVAMKIKRSDALALAKRIRQEKHRYKRSLTSFHHDKSLANQIIDRTNRRASAYKKDLICMKKDKIEFLQQKYNIEDKNRRSIESCHPRVKKILRDLEVFNKDIHSEEPIGPMVCHPEIKLTPNELLVLNKGPKFMVRRDASLEQFLLEVEKSITKQNYNDNWDTEDNCKDDSTNEPCGSDLDSAAERLEIESKNISNFREKSISLGRLRCTEYKYNKRVHLPEPRSADRDVRKCLKPLQKLLLSQKHLKSVKTTDT